MGLSEGRGGNLGEGQTSRELSRSFQVQRTQTVTSGTSGPRDTVLPLLEMELFNAEIQTPG